MRANRQIHSALKIIFWWSLLTYGATAKANQNEPDVEHASMASIVGTLSRVGYPVDSHNLIWTSEVENALNRLATRLGIPEVKDVASAESLLDAIEADGQVPCPPTPVANERDEIREASVTFWGELPDRYLADFYARIALCRPSLLNPKRMDLAKRGKTDAAFPVMRAIGVKEKYALSTKLLSRQAASLGFEKGTKLKPGLWAQISSDQINVRLNTDKLVPSHDELAALCQRFAQSRDCTEQLQPIGSTLLSDGRRSFEIPMRSFELTISLKIRQSDLDRVLIDGIDHMMTANQMLHYGPYAYWPQLVIKGGGARSLASTKAPLLSKVDRRENDNNCELRDNLPSPNECEKLLNQTIFQYEHIINAVGWVPPKGYQGAEKSRVGQAATLSTRGALKSSKRDDQGSTQTKIHVVVTDPGFDKETLQELNLSDDIESFSNVKSLAATNIESTETEKYGHGLHVAHLISGDVFSKAEKRVPIRIGGATFDWGWPGFAYDYSGVSAQRDLIAGTKHREASDTNDPDLYVMPDGGHPKKFAGKAVIFNSSYKVDCKPLSNGKRRYRAHFVETNELNNKGDVFVSSSDNAKDANYFHVVAAPVCPPDVTEVACRYHFPLACLGYYARGIGVVAAEWRSNRWQVMETEPGTDKKKYEPIDDLLWIAAPGKDIWSADARVSDRKLKYIVRARSGSSMAAPIVTALVARLKAKHTSKNWFTLKTWLFATATPLLDEPADYRVIGMVNFERALGGHLGMANIWYHRPPSGDRRPCHQRSALRPSSKVERHRVNNCSWRSAERIVYHNALSDLFDHHRRVIAFMKNRKPLSDDEPKIYMLRLLNKRDDCQRDDRGKQLGMVRCQILVKEEFVRSIYHRECSFSDETLPPCLMDQDGRRISFADESHVVGMDIDHWCETTCSDDD